MARCEYDESGGCSGSQCRMFMCPEECPLWDEIARDVRRDLGIGTFVTKYVHHGHHATVTEFFVVSANNHQDARELTMAHVENADTPHLADVMWFQDTIDRVSRDGTPYRTTVCAAALRPWPVSKIFEVTVKP